MNEMNLEQFAAEMQRLATATATNIEMGINQVAEDVASVSQKLAPLDEGGLMENATVEPAINTGGEITAKVGYNKKYALVRHEGIYNLGATSAAKPSVEGMTVGRKFLAQPLTIKRDQYLQLILKKMGEAIE